MLESLAYSNFYSPAPKSIDPAIFFDLVKIRRLVEEATSLAVRAANGTTASSLKVSNNTGHGILNASDAELLGIGSVKGRGTAKLSRERRHRMREHATQKLSHAYHLDEIASSVAMMQSASALEDVAKLVLQRDVSNPDAQYVHFFHEKIPSRQMADYTTLEALSDIVQRRPTDGSPLRTRAVTRLFKNDHLGAVSDLTEALGVDRLYNIQHRNEERDIVLARDAALLVNQPRSDAKVDEEDQPSSLESQLLFHRGGTYLTLACNHIEAALRKQQEVNGATDDIHSPAHVCLAENEKSRAEARKLVRTYAKRSLRDFNAFLSHFQYTPGISPQYSEVVLRRMKALNERNNSSSGRSGAEQLLDIDSHSAASNNGSSALVKYEGQTLHQDLNDTRGHYPGESDSYIPRPPVYQLHQLFASMPPSDLPPYPRNIPTCSFSNGLTSSTEQNSSLPEFTEAATYHPLLADALHSLLLAHALVQTPPKEHLRHVYMVARLARIIDGYPVFLTARSPARADWTEVLRRTKNWLGVRGKWEDLCNPPSSAQAKVSQGLLKAGGEKETKVAETEGEKRIRRSQEAVLEALADERVVDEQTFRASVRARELRAAREEEEEQRKEYLRTPPSTSGLLGSSTSEARINGHAVENEVSSHPQTACSPDSVSKDNPRRGKEYPITTERADAIARWISEAPPPSAAGENGAGSKPRTKKKAGLKSKKAVNLVGLHPGKTESEVSFSEDVDGASEAGTNALERSIGSLGVGD